MPASLHQHEHELKEKLSYPKTVKIKIKVKVKNRNYFEISTVENKKLWINQKEKNIIEGNISVHERNGATENKCISNFKQNVRTQIHLLQTID